MRWSPSSKHRLGRAFSVFRFPTVNCQLITVNFSAPFPLPCCTTVDETVQHENGEVLVVLLTVDARRDAWGPRHRYVDRHGKPRDPCIHRAGPQRHDNR